LLSCNVGLKKNTADLALIATRVSQGLLQKNFYEQMVAFIQNKTWNFTEYKLLNLSIQFKTEFLFSGEI